MWDECSDGQRASQRVVMKADRMAARMAWTTDVSTVEWKVATMGVQMVDCSVVG